MAGRAIQSRIDGDADVASRVVVDAVSRRDNTNQTNFHKLEKALETICVENKLS